MDPAHAIADFKQRREMYMKVYEPVDTSDGPHIKIVNSREFIGTWFCAIFFFLVGVSPFWQVHVILFFDSE